MSIAYQSRIVLINIGKVLPFVICFIVFVSYSENILSLATNNIVQYADTYTLSKPVSHWIGGVFEYDALSVVVLIIMSYALETCYWNKLAVLYLLLHLIFKNYVQDIVFDETGVYFVSIINAAISGFLTYNGVRKIK